MPVYRVNNPTLALSLDNGHYIAHTVPTGALLTVVDGKTFDGERLMDIMWGGLQVMMFTHDLRLRTTQVTEQNNHGAK